MADPTRTTDAKAAMTPERSKEIRAMIDGDLLVGVPRAVAVELLAEVERLQDAREKAEALARWWTNECNDRRRERDEAIAAREAAEAEVERLWGMLGDADGTISSLRSELVEMRREQEPADAKRYREVLEKLIEDKPTRRRFDWLDNAIRERCPELLKEGE
jgi:hypothetical protein